MVSWPLASASSSSIPQCFLSEYGHQVTPLLKNLHWLPAACHIGYCLAFKALCSLALSFLSSSFPRHSKPNFAAQDKLLSEPRR